VLENGSNPKPKVLQSLGQNSKIIYSLGPESQIVLLHDSISFIGKGRNTPPPEIAPPILTYFNFQYFYTALGTLHGISTTMREKEKSGKHAFKCNNNVCKAEKEKLGKHAFKCNNNVSMVDETLRNPTCKYPRSLA
jgi:hypothetical protein